MKLKRQLRAYTTIYMCVLCVYVYTFVYIHICMGIYVCTHLYVCECMCVMYVCTYLYARVYVYMCVYLYSYSQGTYKGSSFFPDNTSNYLHKLTY